MRSVAEICAGGYNNGGDYVRVGRTMRSGRFRLRLAARQRGATPVEYGLIVGLIAVVTLGAIAAVGVGLANIFGTADDELALATGAQAGLSLEAGAPQGLAIPLTVRLSRTPPDGSTASVRLRTVAGSALPGTDFDAIDTVVSFDGGATAQQLTLQAYPASAWGVQRQLSLSLSEPQNASIAGGSASISLPSGLEAPTLSFADQDGLVLTEGDAPTTVAVQLSTPSASDTTVAWRLEPGTASAEDFPPGATDAQSLTIPAGASGADILLGALADENRESDETATLHLDPAASGLTLAGTASRLVTVPANGDAPRLSLQTVPTAPLAEGSTATLQASLSGTSVETVTPTASIVPGTAAAADVRFPGNGTTSLPLSFAPGSRLVEFDLEVVADTLYEPEESLTLALVDPVGAVLEDASATLTLAANGTMPAVSLDHPEPAEIAEGASATLTLRLSNPSAATVRVPLVLAGSAGFDAGSDLGLAQGGSALDSAAPMVSFAPGSDSATLTLTALDDALFERAETVTLTLGTPEGATVAAGQSTVLALVDNDPAPALSIAGLTLAEGASGAVVLSLDAPSALDTAVTLQWQDGDGTAATPAALSAGGDIAGATIPAGETSLSLPLTARDRPNYRQGDSSLRLAILSADGATPAAPGYASVTVTDSDALPSVSTADLSLDEGASGNIVLTASHRSSTPVTVALQWRDGAGNPAAPTALSAGGDAVQAVIPADALTVSLPVTAADDPDSHGADRALQLALLSAEGATVGSASVAHIAIRETSQPPTVTLTGSSAALTEGETGRSLTISLDRASDRALTVPVTYGGTALRGALATEPNADYNAPTSVTVPAGSRSASIGFELFSDSLYEDDETLTVTLGAPTPAGAASLGSAVSRSLTLRNATAAPTVSLAAPVPANAAEGGSVSFTVARNGSTVRPVTVSWSLNLSGNATAADFTATSGSVELPAGGPTQRSIAVGFVDDAAFENAEGFSLTISLSDSSHFQLGTTTASAQIDASDGYAANCLQLRNQGQATSGEYTIDYDGAYGQAQRTVWCDMVTDGGGWTVARLGERDASFQALFSGSFVNYSRSDIVTASKIQVSPSTVYDSEPGMQRDGLNFRFTQFAPPALSGYPDYISGKPNGFMYNGVDASFINCDTNSSSVIVYNDGIGADYWVGGNINDHINVVFRNPGAAIAAGPPASGYYGGVTFAFGGCGTYTEDGSASARIGAPYYGSTVGLR